MHISCINDRILIKRFTIYYFTYQWCTNDKNLRKKYWIWTEVEIWKVFCNRNFDILIWLSPFVTNFPWDVAEVTMLFSSLNHADTLKIGKYYTKVFHCIVLIFVQILNTYFIGVFLSNFIFLNLNSIRINIFGFFVWWIYEICT